jgi:glucose/mannose-6-phosphate isomerase
VFIRPLRGYKIPQQIGTNDLFFVVSHSGNTEETLAAIEQLKLKSANIVMLTHGGKLLEQAEQESIQHVIIPGGTQPRLTTGYFIAAIIKILENAGIMPVGSVEYLITSTTKLNSMVNEDTALELAKKIAPIGTGQIRVPLIYGQEESEGLAKVAKIKFNENCKIQSFHNFFPELNHNEMIGFTRMIMRPLFIFLKSELSSTHNNLRIEKFIEVLKLKNEDYFIFEMPGRNLITQTFATYVFIDLITLHLAAILDVDPEPVAMVEQFKKMLT